MPNTAPHLYGKGGGAGVVRRSHSPGSNMVNSSGGGLITGPVGGDGTSSENIVRGRTGLGKPMGKGQQVGHSYIDYQDGAGSYPAGDRSPNIVPGSHPNRSGSDTGGHG